MTRYKETPKVTLQNIATLIHLLLELILNYYTNLKGRLVKSILFNMLSNTNIMLSKVSSYILNIFNLFNAFIFKEDGGKLNYKLTNCFTSDILLKHCYRNNIHILK